MKVLSHNGRPERPRDPARGELVGKPVSVQASVSMLWQKKLRESNESLSDFKKKKDKGKKSDHIDYNYTSII